MHIVFFSAMISYNVIIGDTVTKIIVRIGKAGTNSVLSDYNEIIKEECSTQFNVGRGTPRKHQRGLKL